MLEARPGAYLFLGQGEGAGLASPGFDFNDAVAPVGASFFARLVERAQPAGDAPLLAPRRRKGYDAMALERRENPGGSCLYPEMITRGLSFENTFGGATSFPAAALCQGSGAAPISR